MAPVPRLLGFLACVGILAAFPASGCAQGVRPLDQGAFTRRYRLLSHAMDAAEKTGNPLRKRESEARFKAFIDSCVVDKRPVAGWTGRVEWMHLDEDGGEFQCGVNLAPGLPQIIVTNLDEETGEGADSSKVAQFRDVYEGGAIRFSGIIRNPIVFRNEVKVIPNARGSISRLLPWGVVASRVDTISTTPDEAAVKADVEPLPATMMEMREAAADCADLREQIIARLPHHPLDWWEERAAADSAFRRAYHYLAVPRPEATNFIEADRQMTEDFNGHSIRVREVPTTGSGDDLAGVVNQRLGDKADGTLAPAIAELGNIRAELATYKRAAEIVLAALSKPMTPAAPAQKESAEDEELPKPGEYVQVDELPSVVSRVAPVYPAGAMQHGVSGTVMLQVLVGKDGRVRDVRVQKSIPELDSAAISAARDWTFKPAMANSKPVAVWVAVPMKFPQ